MTDKFKTNVLVFLQHVLKIDLKIRFLIDLIDWAQMNQIETIDHCYFMYNCYFIASSLWLTKV